MKNASGYRGHENFKFVWYEEMKSDLPKVIKELCDFLGYPLSKENQEAIMNNIMLDNFKKSSSQPAGERFFRKGVTGDWRNHSTS